MLTEQQLIELEPLTKHPKFGCLLKDAIEVWKRENITPIYGNLGLSRYPYTEKFELHPISKCCCLIGAAMVGKIKNGSAFLSCEKEFNITYSEIVGLWKSFDGWGDNAYDDGDLEAIEFADKIRKIIEPLNYEENLFNLRKIEV